MQNHFFCYGFSSESWHPYSFLPWQYCQENLSEPDYGAVGAHRQTPGKPRLLRGKERFNFLGLLDDKRCLGNERCARGRRRQTRGRAGEELGVKRALELAQRLACGACRHAKPGGGPGEIARLVDGKKNLQLSKRDVHGGRGWIRRVGVVGTALDKPDGREGGFSLMALRVPDEIVSKA